MWTVDALALLINKVREKVDSLIVPTKVSDLVNDAGYVNSAGAAAAAPVQSVNSQTGAVTVSVPTKTSELTNNSGFVDAAGASAAAPVQSVNGNTGSVSTVPFLFLPNNTSALTSQIDALTANGVYSFYILSYGHQSATGMPTNENYYGMVYRGSANYVTVVAYVVGKSVEHYRTKTNGTWGSWT